LEYVTDPRYGWPWECEERFGRVPVQILHEWNSVAQVAEYEGDPRRRPLTYDEVQALFDAADGRMEQIGPRRRKGGVGRDARCGAAQDRVRLRAPVLLPPPLAQLVQHLADAERFGRRPVGQHPAARDELLFPGPAPEPARTTAGSPASSTTSESSPPSTQQRPVLPGR
jgi:hypothetical protein